MAGSIINRGKSTWLVRIFLGRNAEGRREYLNHTIHGTKAAAEEWRTKKLRERDCGASIKGQSITVSEYLDQWLETTVKPKVRAHTAGQYESILRLHVKPAIGAKLLTGVKPPDVQAIYNAMTAAGLSSRSVQYAAMILKQAFARAIDWHLLFYSPCRGVERPKLVKKEMQVLSPDEARRFLAVVQEDTQGALFRLALTTGMRPSEYCGLKWSDFDRTRGTLSVNRTVEFTPGGGWTFCDPKTPRSRRTIKLHSNVVAALVEHEERQRAARAEAEPPLEDHGLIFISETGGPVDPHNLAARNLPRILKAAGLKRIRLYDLRHTAATLSLAAGVPVKVVQEMLGHASAALTLDVYSHVLPHMQDESAAKVEALLLGSDIDTGTQKKRWHTSGTQAIQ
jgi:integrase